ncbi:MAG: metal-dependent hydrolase [Haliea sp.]|nr:metal-dependent hydrolase [Haliea sp.]
MDPLTQGVVGAVVPQSSARPRQVVVAAILGLLGGMAPDLDVLIRSSSDPLLFLEYHRQFTHALVFIPVGGLLCALVLHPLIGRRGGLRFCQSLLFCTLGYATHGLLDACTTYGTLLLWPFSDQRFAWNSISIIDPLFPLPLLALVVLAARRRQPWLARLGVAWAACYLALGWQARDTAVELGTVLAQQRGHQVLRLEAKPGFGNLLVWKVVYETPQAFHVDGLRIWPTPRWYPGESVPKLAPERDLPWLDPDSQQARDLARFTWFSNGYVALDPRDPQQVMDVRYSMLPNEIRPLWSIRLRPNAEADAHVEWLTQREGGRERAGELWAMILGEGVEARPLAIGGG